MADSAVDIGELSASQQDSLQQYTAVTNQELSEAIPLLQRSQWNVQIAISKFFDGEGPDPLAEAMAAETIPRMEARHENLQESLFSAAASPSRGARRNQTDPAPRIVPQQPVTTRSPWVIGLALGLFNWGWVGARSVFRLLFYVLSFLPAPLRPRAVTQRITTGFRSTTGRKMLMPRDTAARFKREFDEEYGPNELPFFEGGFGQAHDVAKKELKFLLVVLMSPEHDDTETFIKGTLLDIDVVNFLKDSSNNVMIWGGNVLDSEAYQVASEYKCTKFPFSTLISLTPKEGSTRMGVIKRLPGAIPPSTYLSEIQATIEKYGPDLAGVRAERTAQEVARSLRNEQDSAYERSLAIDRERARQRREAAAAAEAAERRAVEEAEAATLLQERKTRWKAWRAARILPEPPSGDKNVVRVAIKMPEESGAGRIVRRFLQDAPMEELYAFVECYDLLQGSTGAGNSETGTTAASAAAGEQQQNKQPDSAYEHRYSFRIASTLPREIYEPSSTATMGQKIGRSGNLIVEDIPPESDDEEDDVDDDEEEDDDDDE